MSDKWYTPAGTYYNFYLDLLQQKHLMIAGATGSGKSVIVNGIIYHIMRDAPEDVPGRKQHILIDPKRVELCMYKRLPPCSAVCVRAGRNDQGAPIRYADHRRSV